MVLPSIHLYNHKSVMVSALWPQATYCVINIAHSEEPYPLIMPYLAFLFIYLLIYLRAGLSDLWIVLGEHLCDSEWVDRGSRTHFSRQCLSDWLLDVRMDKGGGKWNGKPPMQCEHHWCSWASLNTTLAVRVSFLCVSFSFELIPFVCF